MSSRVLRVSFATARSDEPIASSIVGSDLTSLQAALVARWATDRLREAAELTSSQTESLSFAEFDRFAHEVWVAHQHFDQPLVVTAVEQLEADRRDVSELVDSEAAARWALPLADKMGLPRQGDLVHTTGPVAYIDVRTAGLDRMTALHELAHLLCDTADTHAGHGEIWALTYADLIAGSFGAEAARAWLDSWLLLTVRALRRSAEDPDWPLRDLEQS